MLMLMLMLHDYVRVILDSVSVMKKRNEEQNKNSNNENNLKKKNIRWLQLASSEEEKRNWDDEWYRGNQSQRIKPVTHIKL